VFSGFEKYEQIHELAASVEQIQFTQVESD